MEVYLVDDEGNIVLTAVTNENGDFIFENLPPDHNYKLKFAESNDALNMIVLDEAGFVKDKALIKQGTVYDATQKESSGANNLFGNIYQKLPGDFSQGMTVYLVDDNGAIIYSTTTDANGDFIFENLPPDHNYSLKLEEVGDEVQMMVFNDFGKMESYKKPFQIK